MLLDLFKSGSLSLVAQHGHPFALLSTVTNYRFLIFVYHTMPITPYLESLWPSSKDLSQAELSVTRHRVIRLRCRQSRFHEPHMSLGSFWKSKHVRPWLTAS